VEPGTIVASGVVTVSVLQAVPLVRCRLDGRDAGSASAVRYVPLAEFGLWRHLMETRHRRRVRVEAVSVWVSDAALRTAAGAAVEDLEPVLSVRVALAGPHGVPDCVRRFFPAETYPEARAALLSHYHGERRPQQVVTTPGYFLPPEPEIERRPGAPASAA
jgi:hypothetical protein